MPVIEVTAARLESGTAGSDPPADGTRARSEALAVWEVFGVLTSFKQNVERLKLYKATLSVIKFLSILNVTYTLVGTIFLMLSLFPSSELRFTEQQQEHLFRLGIFISILSPLAMCTDLIALRGLKVWNRRLLLPWLILYAVLIALAFAVAITEALHHGLRWQLLLLTLCSLCVLSGWRQVRIQYALMGIHPERPTERTIEQLADEIRTATTSADCNSETAGKSDTLPPKYEDLDQPPRYDESLFTPEQRAEGASGASAVASSR